MPEPKGKLDAMTGYSFSTPVWDGGVWVTPAVAEVKARKANGPEGLPPFDGAAWEHVDWRHHEEQVRRLRGRIFKAVQDGDWPTGRKLQKVALRDLSHTLVSVRQFKRRETGRRDPGNDRVGS